MPKIHTTDSGDKSIKWGIAEKAVGGIISALVIGALSASIGVYTKVAVFDEKFTNLDERVTAVESGDFLTLNDASADRIARATHEAAVLEALSSIQAQQIEQTRLLADLSARMTAVEQEIRDAREERMRIEDRLDK